MNTFKFVKDNNHNELEIIRLKGFKIKPKNKYAEKGLLSVKQIEIIHPRLVENLLDKKIIISIKRLIVISDDDAATASDMKVVLDEIERLRGIILKKYAKILDELIIEDKLKKINILLQEIALRAIKREEALLREQELEQKPGRSR